MLSKNKHEGERSIRSSIKKIGGSFERGVLNMFQKKGIVTAKAPEMGENIEQLWDVRLGDV